MSKQHIIAATDVASTLEQLLREIEYDRLYVLTDGQTAQLCYPLVAQAVGDAHQITIPAGDDNKHVDSLCHVWSELSAHGATRHSLLINVGGGMVTDLGGFAAATFKRGISCINVPTTLLAMVDAAVGGKTGINLHSLKNEVGAFYPADAVVVSSQFLHTLDAPNLASGFAEMLKHGLISTEEHWAGLMRYDLNSPNLEALQPLIMESIRTKEHIVEQDPKEQHIRKALNLGHTLGHAFETLAMRRGTPCLHGYAVAWGLVGELYLSHVREGFPADKLRQTISFIKEVYGTSPFTCKDYDELFALMQHDKKNVGTEIRFTLLGGIGDIRIDRTATKEEIFEMLDFVREC
ncbi:MAG: 3-dehydroquinate synthase [Bacteroidaceae bacterium]|nr:3-dehydroquinate synthase [Bacteroidaceae bacterium]